MTAMQTHQRQAIARVAAPLVFLLLATLGVVAVRSALDDTASAPPAKVRTTTAETSARKPATAAKTPAKKQAKKQTAEPAGQYYRVQAGDTFETIAQANGTTVDQLRRLNPDVDPVALQIGQQIRVG